MFTLFDRRLGGSNDGNNVRIHGVREARPDLWLLRLRRVPVERQPERGQDIGLVMRSPRNARHIKGSGELRLGAQSSRDHVPTDFNSLFGRCRADSLQSKLTSSL